jgi:hypothetical protein
MLATATQRFLGDIQPPLTNPWQLYCVAFELSASNVDKAPLEWDTLIQRVRQFAFRAERPQCILSGLEGQTSGLGDQSLWPVVVTDAPRFIDKARLFPHCFFVIGYDTAERLVNPKYYENSRDEMIGALIEMRRLGCKFVVAARAADANKSVQCSVEDDGSISVETGSSNGNYLTLSDMAKDIPDCARELFLELPTSYYKLDLSSSAIRNAKPSNKSRKLENEDQSS